MQTRSAMALLVCQLVWAGNATARVQGTGSATESRTPTMGAQTATMQETQASPMRAVGVTSGLVGVLEPESLRDLALEVLERNPEIARIRHQAAAAANVAPQVKALPDPMLGFSFLALPPETRVGPQRLQAALVQNFPWFGKLEVREQAALFGAAATEADIESARLGVLTETRRLYYELAFLEEFDTILHEEREVLQRYEEDAIARYSSGIGLQQEVIRIQAQITRISTRLLDIAARARTLLAALNALRNRASSTPVDGLELPAPQSPELDLEGLRQSASARRPELVAVDARIAARDSFVELARKDYSPDFTLGLSYTFVGERNDLPGIALPPPDNGSDVLALSGAFNLPIRREKLQAGLEQALELRRAEEQQKLRILAAIENEIGDPASRLPIIFDQWDLFEGVLLIQAEEALRSAEAAYTTGTLNAVDLLDSEVMLFEVRTAAARARADFTIAWVQLEGAIARSLDLVRRAPEDD